MHDTLKAEPAWRYVGTSYDELNCWQLVHQCYQDWLGRDQCPDAHRVLRDLCEVWYVGEDEITPQPHDVLLFALHGQGAHHVGMALSPTEMIHSSRDTGVVIEPIARYRPFLIQIARHKSVWHGARSTPPTPERLLRPTNMVTVRVLRTPILSRAMRPHERILHAPAGMLADVVPPLHADEHRMVYHNGRLVEDMETQAAAGDEVVCIPTMQTVSPLVAAGISLAIGLGISFLSSTLRSTPSANQLATDAERSFTFAGAQSRYTPGGRIPLLFGRRRLALDLGTGIQSVKYAATFVDTTQDVEVARSVLGHERGTIPNNPIATLTVLELQISGTGGAIRPMVGQRIGLRPGTSGQSRARGDYRIATIDYGNDRVKIGINHLKHFNPPSLVGAEVVLQNRFEFNATSENSTLDVFGVLCQGPISAVYPETLELNGQSIDNFPEIEIDYRLGTTPQEPIQAVDDNAFTIGIGQEIVASPAISFDTTIAIDAFRLNVDFNQGLIKFTNEGNTQDNRVTIEYRSRRRSGSFTPWRQVTIVGKSLSPVRVAIERRTSATDFHQIEVRLVGAEQDDPAKGRFTPTLTSITEVVRSQQRYDGIAVINVRNIPADRVEGQVPNMTIIVDGRPCRVGSFSADRRMTNNNAWCIMEMLTGVFGEPDSAINLAGFQAYANHCDVLEDTQNPPVLVNPAYSQLPPIDGLDVQQSQRRRHTLSYLIEAQTREQTIIDEMLAASRVELIREAGQWTPRILRDDETQQLFTMGNVSNVRITYGKDLDKINVVDVQYNDRDNNYERTTTSYPPLRDQPLIVNKLEINARNVDNYDEAYTLAQFELKQRQLGKRRLTFSTNLEGFRLQPFDLHDFAHELPGWGVSGRAATSPNNTTTHVVLDRSVNMVAGTNYHLYCRFANAVTEIRSVTNPGTGTYTEVDVTPAFSQVPNELTVFAFGEASPNTAVIPFRVISAPVYNESTGLMDVECIEHIPALYSDAPPEAPPPITTLPNFQNLPPEILDIDVTEFLRIDTTGARIATAWLSWTVDRLETGDAPYRGAIIQRRRVTTAGTVATARVGEAQIGTLILPSELEAVTDYETLAEVYDGAKQYDDQKVFPGETYQYRIIPVSVRGVWSLTRAAYYVHHVTGTDQGDDGTRPETPQNLRLAGLPAGTTNFEGPDIVFEWDRPRNEGAARSTNLTNEWQVQIYGTSGANVQAYLLYPGLNQPAVLVNEPRFAFTQALNAEAAAAVNLPPQRNVTIQVWARTQLQNQSIVPAVLTVNNAPPDMSGITPTVTARVGGVLVDWRQFLPPRDIAGYRIVIDPANPPPDTGALVDTVIAGDNTLYEATGLTAAQHSVVVTPLDTFGPGIATPVALQTPFAAARNVDEQKEAITTITDATVALTDNPLTFNLQGKGFVILQGVCSIQLVNASQFLQVSIREDSATGSSLRIVTAQWDGTSQGSQLKQRTVMAVFPVTGSGAKSFYLVGDNAGGGTTGSVSVTQASFLGQYVIGEE